MLKKRLSAFTLVELLVAMAIISVLIGLAIGAISLTQRVSRDGERRSAVAEINAGLNAYYGSTATYPDKGASGSTSSNLLRRVGEDVVVGTITINLRGAARAQSDTDVNGALYCYRKNTNGYLLGVLLEDGAWYTDQSTDPGTDPAGTCAVAANQLN